MTPPIMTSVTSAEGPVPVQGEEGRVTGVKENFHHELKTTTATEALDDNNDGGVVVVVMAEVVLLLLLLPLLPRPLLP